MVLLLYRDNGGHPQLICNIHRLMIQRRELLSMTEIQPPVKLPGDKGGGGGRRERISIFNRQHKIPGYGNGIKDRNICIH